MLGEIQRSREQAGLIPGDHAQGFLVSHLAETQRRLRSALRRWDPNADCEVRPAADLGIPYDSIRLAGGFATGCFIQWSSSVPVVPIDTTMNIDTSSVFWLEGDQTGAFNQAALHSVRDMLVTESSYEWNFERGNHFISLCRDRSNGRLALVIHSNEKEFKDQFNGLCPTPGNWFEDDIRSQDGIRLLVGPRAELFSQMAKMLEEFNIVRHKFVARMIVGDAEITSEMHKHHYYMPTTHSAAIGCFVCEPGETVPVFSAHGKPVSMFRPRDGGENVVDVEGLGRRLIVAHGWGMGSRAPLAISISDTALEMNGHVYPRTPGVSLLDHEDVVPRSFTAGNDEFFDVVSHHMPGDVVGSLDQVASLSRLGFVTHDPA